jgi:hypothetical protein
MYFNILIILYLFDLNDLIKFFIPVIKHPPEFNGDSFPSLYQRSLISKRIRELRGHVCYGSRETWKRF